MRSIVGVEAGLGAAHMVREGTVARAVALAIPYLISMQPHPSRGPCSKPHTRDKSYREAEASHVNSVSS